MVIAKIGGEQWGGRFPIRNDSGGSQSEIIALVERSLSDSVFKTYFLLVMRLLALKPLSKPASTSGTVAPPNLGNILIRCPFLREGQEEPLILYN